MTPAFTKGPWRVGIWYGDKERAHVVDMGVPDGVTTFAMLRPASSMFPASAVVHSDGDRCEVEANARLIAAAPDLYEALEHILAGALSLPRFAEEQARAALAKARGDPTQEGQ